jgi:hypothetical protein
MRAGQESFRQADPFIHHFERKVEQLKWRGDQDELSGITPLHEQPGTCYLSASGHNHQTVPVVPPGVIGGETDLAYSSTRNGPEAHYFDPRDPWAQVRPLREQQHRGVALLRQGNGGTLPRRFIRTIQAQDCIHMRGIISGRPDEQ